MNHGLHRLLDNTDFLRMVVSNLCNPGNCLNHGLNRLLDNTDFFKNGCFYNPCNPDNCLNHGLNRLKDNTDFLRMVVFNPCIR